MHFSALIVQRRVTSDNGAPVWEDAAPPYRVNTITNVTTMQEHPSGYTEAGFVIPADRVRFDPEDMQKNTLVWLFDGDEPIFYGHVVKAIPLPSGEVSVALNGAYRKLGPGPDDGTRMRIVWADADLSQWQPMHTNKSGTTAEVKSDGSLKLAFTAGTKYHSGEHVAVDYFLFGEGAGVRDRKRIDGIYFEMDTARFNDDASGTYTVQIWGMEGPSDPDPDLLYETATQDPVSRHLVSDGSSGFDANGWPVQTGYRCLRIGLYCNADDTIGADANDRAVSFSVIRVSTRARTIQLLDEHQTSTLLKDLWDNAGNGYDIHHLLQEEFIGSTGEAVVGAIEASGQYVAELSFSEWTAPNEIVETIADISGFYTGMWLPTRVYGPGSHVTSGSVGWNYRYRQPPELVHRPWSPLSEPDYFVRLQRGAQWDPDGQGDSTSEATYTNYSTRAGRQRSVFVEDTTDENFEWQQGWHDAGDWTVDSPVGDATASTLASQYNATRRQPTLSGTLTITGDMIGAILGSGGERITKLSTLRLGVTRIVDAKGPRAGRITAIRYSARTASTPETVELTINAPTGARLDRRLARMALRAEQNLH